MRTKEQIEHRRQYMREFGKRRVLTPEQKERKKITERIRLSTPEQREIRNGDARRHYWRHVERLRPERREYQRGRYVKNKAEILERNKAYKQKYREEWAMYDSLFRMAFPEKFKPISWEKRHEYRRAQFARKFGLTIAERDALFAANDGLCHICSKVPSIAIDHCHDTGRVRGALCQNCNFMLGHGKDDPEILLAAADYLRRETCVIS